MCTDANDRLHQGNQEYLERLRQVRQRNYAQKRNVQQQHQKPMDEEQRRLKVQQLRQQADERAHQLQQKRPEQRALFEATRRNEDRPEKMMQAAPAVGDVLSLIKEQTGYR